MEVPQAVARPVRTATQMALSAVIMEVIDSTIMDMSDRQYAAWTALLTIILGYAQVIAENYAGKGFLRKPKPRETPVEVIEGTAPEGSNTSTYNNEDRHDSL